MKKLLLLLLPFLFISCMPLMHDLENEGNKQIKGKVSITDNAEESKLTASYTGSEPVTYQWYKGDTEIPGETSTTLSYDVATMGGDVLSVKVTGTDEYSGTVSSNSLTVISGDVSTDTDYENSLVKVTYTGSISAENLKYTWYKQNDSGVYELITDSTESSLYVPEIYMSSFYKIVIMSDDYCGRLVANHILGCVIAGTMIEMGDGSFKAVEEIELGDAIMSFDYQTGSFVANKVVCIDEAINKTKQVLTLTAKNGYSISFVDIQTFFDVETKKFFDITNLNYESMTGKTILVKEGESLVETTIESITSKIEVVSYYEIIPEKTFKFFANGFMTVIPESLLGRPVFELLENEYKYDPVKMEQDINTYGLYTYETFPLNITKEFFDAYNFAVLKIYIEKGYVTLEEVEESIDWHFSPTVRNAFKVR